MFRHLVLTAAGLCLCLLAPTAARSALPECRIDVTIVPETGTLHGRIAIIIAPGSTVRLQQGHAAVERCRRDGQLLPALPGTITTTKRACRVLIEFCATYPPVHGASTQRIISARQVSLLDQWYPGPAQPARCRLTVRLPQGYTPISEGRAREVRLPNGALATTWDFPHPRLQATLVAGRYRVSTRRINGYTIATLLYTEDRHLRDRYMTTAAAELAQTAARLGPYPFGRFTIVENHLHPGLSFAGYTLTEPGMADLRQAVISQWLGNCVYPDPADASWFTGLVRYLARPAHIDERAFRARSLTALRSQLMPATDGIPPAPQRTAATRALLLQHNLRTTLGSRAYFALLRRFIVAQRFARATWRDLADAGPADMAWFFSQWADRSDLIALDCTAPRIFYRDGSYVVQATITQADPPLRFNLPYRLVTDTDSLCGTLPIDACTHAVTLRCATQPQLLILDEQIDLPRVLSPAETVPLLAALSGPQGRLLIAPDMATADPALRQRNWQRMPPAALTSHVIETRSLLLPLHSPTARYLGGPVSLPPGMSAIAVQRHPFHDDRVIGLMQLADAPQLATLLDAAGRHPTASAVTMTPGGIRATTREPEQYGIHLPLAPQVHTVVTETLTDLQRVVERIGDSRVICIGEQHTAYAHHVMQREIIRRLHDRSPHLIIGMEMFQRPFQDALDGYIAGSISEPEMLRRTEYFERWGYDWRLYRDIAHLARARRIPLYALNIDREITAAIARRGIQTLTPAQRTQLPQRIDLQPSAYRRFLRQVFAQHPAGRPFSGFYLAQLVWDEIMAQTASTLLADHPHARLVILAGNGHLEHSWGIPRRIRRQADTSVTVIINSPQGTPEAGTADIILYPADVPFNPTPRLGIEFDPESLRVRAVAAGGIAERAGIKRGDRLTRYDTIPLLTPTDLRLQLTLGDDARHHTLTVTRRHWLRGTRELPLRLKP